MVKALTPDRLAPEIMSLTTILQGFIYLKKHLTGIRNQVKGTELASMAEEIREPI